MTTTTGEIDDYVTAVHAALADLPDAEREDLLDDLPQHLADVRADRVGSLTDLLGTPAAYAAELRATAGLDAGPQQRPLWDTVRARLLDADERIGRMLGYQRLAELVRALAPAWWLVRAWLLVELCTGATQQLGARSLTPEINGNKIAGSALLGVALVGSVWLGRRGTTRHWQRIALVVLGIALAGYGVALLHHAAETHTVYESNDSTEDGNDVSGVSNIYPVGPDGTVLQGVRLYDQDGNPVQLGDPGCPGAYYQVDGSGDGSDDGGRQIYQGPVPAATSAASADGANVYPLTCDTAQGPFASAHPPALPSASAAPSASGSSSPAASPVPSVSPSPLPSSPVASASSSPRR